MLDVERARVGGAWRGARGRARVDVGGAGAPALLVLQGEHVRLFAQLSLPRGALTEGAFDPVAQAFREGVHAAGFCKSALLVRRRTPRLTGWPWTRAAARARGWSQAAFAHSSRRWCWPWCWRRIRIGNDAADAFRAAGTYHVLYAARRWRCWPRCRSACSWMRVPPIRLAVAVCIALAFYAQLVGGDVPVVRAAVMATVPGPRPRCDRRRQPAGPGRRAAARPSSIAVGDLQLLLRPPDILLLTPPLLLGIPTCRHRHLALAGSVAAQIALGALALQFYRLAPAALLLNLAAVSLSAAVLLLRVAHARRRRRSRSSRRSPRLA